MVNHCEKHPKFIPTCKECNKQRDLEKFGNKDIFLRKETQSFPMPKDDKGNDIFHRKFEKVIIVNAQAPECETYFISMDSWGYDFVTQLDFRPIIADAILIFKKREE